MDLTSPDRRLDVLASLDFLASAPPTLEDDRPDPRWPDLTSAVHWLVDDTSWDARDPGSDVGSVLESDAEADALRDVVTALLDVAGRHGAGGSDRSWFGDGRWPTVRRLAARAAVLMRSG